MDALTAGEVAGGPSMEYLRSPTIGGLQKG